MKAKAKLGNLRIAPRKVRLVADLVRRKTVEEAQTVLSFTVKRAAPHLKKLLDSAVANAKNNLEMDPSNLYISKVIVDEGPKFKRWRARAMGRAGAIEKKTSHITIVLSEIKKSVKKKIVKKTKGMKKVEPRIGKKKIEKKDKIVKEKKEKFKREMEVVKPKVKRRAKRVFRRKAF